MAKIIRATCTTNSADDKMGRVKLKSEGIWNQETELVMSLNGCPLSKGDAVFVSIEDGMYAPIILGKADRNEIVLNLLVEKINSLEDKINDMVDKQNEVIMKLAASPSAAGFVWSGAATFAGVMQLQRITKKTKLKDIQDNYK